MSKEFVLDFERALPRDDLSLEVQFIFRRVVNPSAQDIIDSCKWETY